MALVEPTSLAEAMRIVSDELAAAEAEVGPYADNPRGRHELHRAAMVRLAASLSDKLGARCSDRWDGARVRINGVTSTSTMGLANALRNWLVAATKREANR